MCLDHVTNSVLSYCGLFCEAYMFALLESLVFASLLTRFKKQISRKFLLDPVSELKRQLSYAFYLRILQRDCSRSFS